MCTSMTHLCEPIQKILQHKKLYSLKKIRLTVERRGGSTQEFFFLKKIIAFVHTSGFFYTMIRASVHHNQLFFANPQCR